MFSFVSSRPPKASWCRTVDMDGSLCCALKKLYVEKNKVKFRFLQVLCRPLFLAFGSKLERKACVGSHIRTAHLFFHFGLLFFSIIAIFSPSSRGRAIRISQSRLPSENIAEERAVTISIRAIISHSQCG